MWVQILSNLVSPGSIEAGESAERASAISKQLVGRREQLTELLAKGNTGSGSERRLAYIEGDIQRLEKAEADEIAVTGFAIASTVIQGQNMLDQMADQSMVEQIMESSDTEQRQFTTAAVAAQKTLRDSRPAQQGRAPGQRTLPGYPPVQPGAVNDKGQLALPMSTTPAPAYFPSMPGVVNTKGQLALPADPGAIRTYNWAASTQGRFVLGTFETIKGYSGDPKGSHVTLLDRPAGIDWTIGVNDAAISARSSRGMPFMLPKMPSNADLQPFGFQTPFEQRRRLGEPYLLEGGRGYGPSGGPVLERELGQLLNEGYFWWEGLLISPRNF
jgi:hypothetical protein